MGRHLPASARAALKTGIHIALGPLTVPPVAVVALSQRRPTQRRRRRGERPRVLFGPQPIINIKDWSKALASRGYVSRTFVNGFFPINRRDDFDYCREDRYWPSSPFDSLKAYLAFGEALVRYDAFHFFFDGGLLGDTPFWWIESPLLKLAGKKLVVSGYGGDIAVPGYLGPYENAMTVDYPWVAARGKKVRRKVDHFCRHADLAIGTLQIGYLPRHDMLWVNQLAMDTDLWQPADPPSRPPDASVVILHAPNHRALKGTPALIEAVDRLREEGVNCELVIVEKQPREILLEEVATADIVVDQLLLGFGLFALEAMSRGKPVVSNIGWMPELLRSTPSMKACPLVDANTDTITEVLRRLVGDASLRSAVGAASREWIVDFHSLAVVGRIWDGVFSHIWAGSPLPSTGANASCRLS